MKAFLAHSFRETDKDVVDRVRQFVESAGLEVITGEKAQNRSVAQKVRERITGADVFVGLFTRDRVLSDRGRIARYLRPRDRDVYTTSYWVIQESGFAIGLDKQMVLLVEEGISAFPELQGDMEVVPFDRGSLERSFVKVNQMLEHIKSRTVTPGAMMPPSEISATEATDDAMRAKQEEDTEGQRPNAPMGRLFEAVYARRDYKEAQKIFDEELAPTLKPDDGLYWRAWVLRHSHALGDGDAFAKLVHLTEEHSESPISWEGLAQRYEDIGEFSRAYESYSRALTLYDVRREPDRDPAISCAQRAASCLAMDAKYREGISLLERLMQDRELATRSAKLFGAMAQVARTAKVAEDFLVYGEAALDADPLDTELMFNVAYDYSQAGQNCLALLHYRKLIRTTTNAVGSNNLGVCLRDLKLTGKSISHFRVAAEMGLTLALGNLSHLYLDGGFLHDAEEQIQEAQRIVKDGGELHARVASAIERLARTKRDEDESEQRLLSQTDKERTFRVRHAKAMVTTHSGNGELAGEWETPWGKVRIEFDTSTKRFSIDHKYSVEVPAYGTTMVLGLFSTSSAQREDKHVRIEGTVHGLSARCDITITGNKAGTLLTSNSGYSARAFMVIADTWDRIDVMEKTTDEKVEFRQWKRITTDGGSSNSGNQ